MNTILTRVYRPLFAIAICALAACSGNSIPSSGSGSGFTPALSAKATTVTVKTVKGKAIVKNVPVKILRCVASSVVDCLLDTAKFTVLARGTTNNRGIAKLSANFTPSQLICAEGIWKVGTSTSSVRNCTSPFPSTIEVDFQ